jgi:transcriptional regulator with XRE-family HTH domain
MKIHALYQGSPLCGFSDKFPKDWPRNNKWTSFKSEDEITCSICKERAKVLNQIPVLTLGSFVRSLRKKQKIKQKVFAEQLGINSCYLSLIETNKEKPSINLITKIAANFNLSTEDLILQAYEINSVDKPLQGKKREGVKEVLREIILLL